MKEYNVKINTINENILNVTASSEREALSKVEELICSSKIKDIFLIGVSKHYTKIGVCKKN